MFLSIIKNLIALECFNIRKAYDDLKIRRKTNKVKHSSFSLFNDKINTALFPCKIFSTPHAKTGTDQNQWVCIISSGYSSIESIREAERILPYLQNRRSDFVRNHERLLFNYFKIVVEQCSFPLQKPFNNTQGPW